MTCLRDGFRPGVVLNDGRYKIIAPLNKGSFGMVALAQDLQTKQRVAIKTMMKGGELGVLARREIQIHSLFKSEKHIVNYIDSFETEAHIYLVMEYCRRGDMYEAITNRRAPVSAEQIREFMLQLVDVVSTIHEKGVFHRDIKPENLFLTEAGTLKLGDFGLATRDKQTCDNGVGSDRYMPPEQYDESDTMYETAKSDYWCIGITLLNLLFSRNPFKTTNDKDILWRDYVRDRQTLYDVFPTMSSDTFEAIQYVLSPDPEKRDLVGFRNAVENIVEWTTHDVCGSMDDFVRLTEEQKSPVPATTNRQPLRTPSVLDASPSKEPPKKECFPWKTALERTQPIDAPRPRPIQVQALIEDELNYTPSLTSSSSMESASTLVASMSLKKDIAASVPRQIKLDRVTRDRSHLQFGKSWSDLVEFDMERDKKNVQSRSPSEPLEYVEEDWMPHWDI